MVGADGQWPLPWLDVPLAQVLSAERAHAWMLHGPQGVGQFELAMTVAQAWLCERDQAGRRPCGACAACRLVQAHSHPDLMVVMPQATALALGWDSAVQEGDSEPRGAKTKPSKEIKVDAVRDAVAFAQVTSARGGVKVVVLHPAEQMNDIAANTLLKTLEEPPGRTRFVLSVAAPQALPPTVRSRCQSLAIGLPPTAMAAEWLTGHGVDGAECLLAGAGGQPLLALEWARAGVDAQAWTRLPGQVRQGQVAGLVDWPLPRVIDALQKLCHDAACVAAGAPARYFPAASVPGDASLPALAAWMRDLARAARHAEHPWNGGLMAQSLVQQGQRALQSCT